jgi:hypothetical protein
MSAVRDEKKRSSIPSDLGLLLPLKLARSTRTPICLPVRRPHRGDSTLTAILTIHR